MIPSMKAMDIRVLKKKMEGNSIILLDVRTPGEHRKLHVKDAILLPLDSIDEKTIAQLKESVNGQEICTLCVSGRRSALAARKLLDAGFENVSILQGGLRSWKDAEYPLIRGKGSISINRQARMFIGALVIAGTAAFWYTHEEWWLAMPAFFGIGLIFSGATGIRGINTIMRKMPWNR